MFDSRSVRYSTASQEGHLTQSPSGTDLRNAVSERLIRGGSNFSSQLIVILSFQAQRRPAHSPQECDILHPLMPNIAWKRYSYLNCYGQTKRSVVQRLTNPGHETLDRFDCPVRRRIFQLLNNPAADDYRIGYARQRFCRCCIPDAETNADR